jgi:hypothetical protein
MKFGSPIAAGFGAPENALALVHATLSGPSLKVRSVARDDLKAAWFQILRNSKHCEYLYLEQSDDITRHVPSDGSARQAVSVLRCGCAPADLSRAARWYDAKVSRRTTHIIYWIPQIKGSVDATGATKLSSWSLSGLTYGGTDRVAGFASRGALTVEITVDGSDVDLSIYCGSVLVASGSGTVDGSVTLAGTLSGSVTVAADAATGTETLSIHWPASCNVKRGTTSPPSAVVASVPFNAADYAAWTEPSDLTAGTTYYYAFGFVSDSGVVGTYTSPVTLAVPAPPVPPSGLVYDSGAYDAVVLDFVPSSTGGATHRAYIQGPSDPSMPTGHNTGATFGTGTVTLPELEYPGTTRVQIRAVAGGLEEAVGATLDIELDSSGNYVAPRPNTPTIRGYTAAGLAATVNGVYATAGEKGTATQLKMRVKSPGGSYGAVVDSTALAAAGSGAKIAALDYTFAAAGWYWVKVTAATAAAIESDAGAEMLVYVTDAAPAAVVSDSYGSRG